MLQFSRDKRLIYAYSIFLVLIATLAITRVAWVSDDALITLRTALNMAQGWGPGFNATESVQAYTHPLWFLAILAMGSATGQWLLGIFVASIGACALTIVLLVRVSSTIGRSTLVVGLLLLSNAFVDFSTSGLENPLAFLAVGLLFVLSIRTPSIDAEKLPLYAFWSGLTVSAVLLLRLDLSALIGLPVLVLVLRFRKSWRALAIFMAATLTPLVVWFLWTYINYSSLLPNTLAAKTNADIPRVELIYGGFRYLWISFQADPVSLLIVLGALLLSVALGTTSTRAWGVGIVVYLTYVVWIGGDFMAGRFVSIPVVVALFIIASVESPSSINGPKFDPLTSIVTTAVVLVTLLIFTQAFGSQLTSLTNPQAPRWDIDQRGGIADERGEYVQRGWALQDLFVLTGDVRRGDEARQVAQTINAWPQVDPDLTLPEGVETVCGGLGITGITAGPSVHVIDQCALSDRFLSEIVFTPTGPMGWRPGHLIRDVPEGYIDAVRFNDPARLASPEDTARLEQLWSEIR